MEYIHASDSKQGVKNMENRIASVLLTGKPVLWLICGGSNLPAAVKVMELVRQEVTPEALKLLHVGQTDERYGIPGHADSNWKQMLDMGFNFHGIDACPILIGKSLEATVTEYNDKLKQLFEEVKAAGGMILAHCGVGVDGHIAGIMPNSQAVSDPRLVFGYESGKYIRVTVTPVAFRHFTTVFTFAFDAPKHDVLTSLRDQDLPLEKQPAQILKSVPESYIYSDQY